ncbi:hypothetical protein FKM82_020224 [Ascaphus truei]
MCIPNVKWESNHKPRYLKLVTGVRVVLALVLIRSSVTGSFKNLVLVPNTIVTVFCQCLKTVCFGKSSLRVSKSQTEVCVEGQRGYGCVHIGLCRLHTCVWRLP